MNFFFILLFSSFLHPYFVSQTNVFYDEKEKELQCTLQFFLDDFESAISQEFSHEKIMINNNSNENIKNKIKKFILNDFKVFTDDSLNKLNFMGFEVENGNILCFVFIENFLLPKKEIKIFNALLYKHKPLQTHIFHAKIGTKELSMRIQNPEQYFHFIF